MLDLNKNFVDEVYDENGHVVDYTLKCPENFNFAYDVVDDICYDYHVGRVGKAYSRGS